MSNAALFFVGVAVTIPAAGAIGGLLLAAVADGRENDRVQAQMSQGNDEVALGTPPRS